MTTAHVKDRRTTRTGSLQSKSTPLANADRAPLDSAIPWPLVIPASAFELEGFREWSHQPDFPERGSIFFLDGEIYIDMSPERFESHNDIKAEIFRVLLPFVARYDLGRLQVDGARIVNTSANVSNEPDAFFFTWEALRSGRVKKIPTADGKNTIELEGSPDCVIEVVSPSSVKKDTSFLLDRYHRAEVAEYWLIDARGEEIDFRIYRDSQTGYVAQVPSKGWLSSIAFGRAFRFVQVKNRLGDLEWRLKMKV